jgi:outer membrane protein assembly factor BamB
MKNLTYLSLFVIVLLAACSSEKSQTIAQWRGDNRDGVYHETNLLKVWPDQGPKLLWETEIIGKGYGSPVVTVDAVYVNGEVDSISHLFAFDLNGKLLWKTPNGPEFFGNGFSSGYPGARSTPTVYKGFVYVSSGLGRIACFDAKTGKELWTKHMVNDFGGIINEFGYCESLLVDEKLVYCFPGGTEKNAAALDRFTGNVVWTSKAISDLVAFTSPILITLPERNLFVTISRNKLFALDALNGELLWAFKEDSFKWDGEYCNTPLYSDGFIYGISGIEKGTGAYKLQLAADGKSIKEVWRNSQVKNGALGFVKIDDNIFTPTDSKKLMCLDCNTGLVVDTLKNIRGGLIYADNQFYLYGDNGNMNLIGLSGTKMELISKFKVEKGDKEHIAHPVIRNGVLYIRHGKALMAYRIK